MGGFNLEGAHGAFVHEGLLKRTPTFSETVEKGHPDLKDFHMQPQNPQRDSPYHGSHVAEEGTAGRGAQIPS